MVKAYLYDLNNLNSKEEYMYRNEQASDKRRPALCVYGKDIHSKAIVNLGVSAVLDEALREYGLREKTVEIECGKYGKPRLKEYKDIHFNISHSGKYVMCAAANVPVGADVQENLGSKNIIAKRFFSREEYERIIACADDNEAAKLFYRYWTLKESYVKALGVGIGDAFVNAVFVPDREDGSLYDGGLKLLRSPDSDRRDFIFREYDLCGYRAAVCSVGDKNITDIKLIGGKQNG